MSEGMGINGFGRVGLMVARALLRRGARLVAVNDPEVTAEQMAHMLQHDSTQGAWPGEVRVVKGRLMVGKAAITVYQETRVSTIPWSKAGARYIIETQREGGTTGEPKHHLTAGAYKVVVARPVQGLPTLIMGANEQEYSPEVKLLSGGCPTSSSLAPLVKLLHTKLGIGQCMVASVHGAQEGGNMVDGAGEDWRAGRGVLQNIVPLALGLEGVLAQVVPALEGRVGGTGLRVQSPAVGLLDLTLQLEKEVDYEKVCAAVRKASEGSLSQVLGFTDEPLVSSDLLGEERAVVDLGAGLQLGEGLVKLVVWYDSEACFGARLSELVLYLQVADTCPHASSATSQAMDQDRAPSRESSIASDNYASRSGIFGLVWFVMLGLFNRPDRTIVKTC